jgi:hypothetical protein
MRTALVIAAAVVVGLVVVVRILWRSLTSGGGKIGDE